MAWITDSLRGAISNAVTALNPFGQGPIAPSGIFTHQLAIGAYMASGMMRKVIAIPAEDRVREWRDWQAPSDDITKLEAEEVRLKLRAKVRYAEVLRGIGGGAIVIIAEGDHAQPLDPKALRPGGIIALNVLSRWQITGKDWNQELASPTYGEPAMFEVGGGNGNGRLIHPSRVIAFRGDPLPVGQAVSHEDAYWGDSRLLRVMREVENSDNAQLWFAQLVRKAKLLRIGIANLSERLGTEKGQSNLNARVGLIATGESTLNATVFDAGDGKNPAETISDYQVSFAGIPAMMDAFDQRIAAVADIPMTRLIGRSPGGMNATGQSDTDNWNKAVKTGQELELRPCLAHLDPFLLRSAGVTTADVTWRFAPLDVPTEKQEAETFKVFMEAIEKLQATGAIPDVALTEAIQNAMEEREYLPGLSGALAKLPENIRFGVMPDADDDDPSSLTQQRGGDQDLPAAAGGDGSAPVRRSANDGKEVGEGANTPFVDARIYRRDKRGRFASSNGSKASIVNFLAKALRSTGDHMSLDIGVADSPSPPSVRGFARRLQTGQVQHALVKHGDRAVEARLGQLPISVGDIARVPQIVTQAHTVEVFGSRKGGAGQSVRYTAQIGAREYTYVERVGTKRRQLTFMTMWKK